MNKIDQLPSELLCLILDRVDPMHLCTCAFINKRFHNQTIPLLWRRLDIDSETALTKFTYIITTSPYLPGAYIQSLTLTFRLSGTALLALVQHTPLLEHLALTETTSITDTSFKHVPRHCPHLYSLSIYRGDITLLSMVALGKHCQHLGALRLKLCPYLDYGPLFYALRACPVTVIDITPCDMYRKESRHVSEAMAWSMVLWMWDLSRR